MKIWEVFWYELYPNGLDDCFYVYHLELLQGHDFVVPDGIQLSEFICEIRIGDEVITSKASKKLGKDFSLLLHLFYDL